MTWPLLIKNYVSLLKVWPNQTLTLTCNLEYDLTLIPYVSLLRVWPNLTLTTLRLRVWPNRNPLHYLEYELTIDVKNLFKVFYFC